MIQGNLLGPIKIKPMHWISDIKEHYWVNRSDEGHNLPGTWDSRYQDDLQILVTSLLVAAIQTNMV
jgi:hypothetical protein